MKITIVDENDTEVGQKERDELTSEDIYRVSSLWVTNSKGEALLARRAFSKKKSPGLWGPAVAGTVEAHETYEDNILKETREEIGVILAKEDLRKGPKVRRATPGNNYFGQWYFATIDKKLEEFVFQEEEVAALQWISVADFRQTFAKHPEEFLPSTPDWITIVLTGHKI